MEYNILIINDTGHEKDNAQTKEVSLINVQEHVENLGLL